MEKSGASPLVAMIVTTLTERILTNQYGMESGFPSERALGSEFAVSRVLIRRVMDILEQNGLVARVPRCRTLVRVPSRQERPVSARPRSLGLWLWPGSSEPGASALFQGICRALKEQRCRLVIGQIEYDTWHTIQVSEARFLEEAASDSDICGLLLWYLGGQQNLAALQQVRAANIPMVFMDRRPPEGIEADFVGVNNVYSAEQIVRHLLSLGHRRIAHITNRDSASPVAERAEGYRHALAGAGIPFDPALVVPATERSFAEAPPVYEAMLDSLLGLSDPPTAAFAVNDITANRLLLALEARGVPVPEGMAVAGFDGLRRWDQGSQQLTTAFQPFDQMGASAASLLLQRIESGAHGPYQHVLLEAPLQVGSTTYRER